MSEKEHKAAIALSYDQKSAPRVSGKAYGKLADELIEAAQEMGILIHEDPGLLAMLDELKLDEEIPEQMFVIIAELIAFAYVLQGKFPEGWTPQGIDVSA